MVGEDGQAGGGEVRPGGEVLTLLALVLEEAAQQQRSRGVRMVLGQQYAYAEIVVGGQAFYEVGRKEVVRGRLPARQRVAGVRVSAHVPGVAGPVGLGM